MLSQGQTASMDQVCLTGIPWKLGRSTWSFLSIYEWGMYQLELFLLRTVRRLTQIDLSQNGNEGLNN